MVREVCECLQLANAPPSQSPKEEGRGTNWTQMSESPSQARPDKLDADVLNTERIIPIKTYIRSWVETNIEHF